MSEKQKQAIDLIQRFSPKDFGIKKAFYKIDGNIITFLFVVDKKNTASVMSYLNSLSSIVENKIKGIEVKSSVYVYNTSKDFVSVARDEKFKNITQSLNSLEFAGATC